MQNILEAILQIDILSPPREYFEQVMGAVCDSLGYAFAHAVEVASRDECRFFAAYRFPLLHEASAINDIEAYIAALTADEQGVFIISDPSQSVQANRWHHVCQDHDVKTVVFVPLINGQHILGWFSLYDCRERQVPAREIEMLAKVSEMASVAIASNRYLEQLNQRTAELQGEVTERRRVEAALREALQERRALEEIVNHSPVVVILWKVAPGWPVEFVSKSVEQYGYTPDDLYGESAPFSSLLHPADLENVNREIEQHLDDGILEFTLEFRVVTKSGDVRWVEAHIWGQQPAAQDNLPRKAGEQLSRVTHLQGVMQDVTERKRAEETIRHQAFHDTLTDLPNRLLFHDRLTMALRHARRNKQKLAVMFLDLDRFKNINDTLGHGVGDELLKGIATRLRNLLREEDTISRLGGDEFTILLPEIKDPKDAEKVALKILDVLDPSFHISGHELHITTSIDISLYPMDGPDAQTLLQNADSALYHAKERGRNTVQFYNPSMKAKTLERLALENGLRHALERNEIQVYYQPQVAITTSELIGMEALVRWLHPTMGLISPAQFIPLAEETGLIEPIGHWVLREACAQNRRWQEEGFPAIKVAVNLSARQFHQPNLATQVASVLAETSLDPSYLELEITESVAMRNVDYSVNVMRGLKSMGVRLSMDDFGVGYSSLIYLKKFPINTLKIDQSFIRCLTTDPNDEAIAKAIIAMARSLKLHVIAEGVETEAQMGFLREHQCDGMQGYLFSKPLPADAFGQLLRFLSM